MVHWAEALMLGHAQSRRQFLQLLGWAGLSASNAPPAPLFEEIPASVSRLTWVHDNAMSPSRYLPESLGPGCAFLDYDNDGWMDIYLVNSGPCDFFQPGRPIRNALYRNNRDGTFTDLTLKAGVPGAGFGMGVAVGDFDNDGNADLLVTGYGQSVLYRNNGDGTFTDVTAKAGLELPKWTTSAVWFDYDNDGFLDLFVCSFVEFGLDKHVYCGDNKLGRRYYCIPKVFRPTASVLFRNNGDGTFTKVSGGTEIEKALGKGLGVVATDVNNDGRMDLFVANDTVQNFLFLNRGDGSWSEASLSAGVAYSADGKARSGMGVDAVDLDGDGWQDLFVANVDSEMFSLYRNNQDETFSDDARLHGIAQATRQLSGWGLKFFDYDNDGSVDLLLANGHPDDMVEMYNAQVKYREPLLLFHQEGGKLRNVSQQAGPVFQKPLSARGMAVGDFNNDGRLDVLVGVNGGAPVLLKNQAGAGNGWAGVRLVGKECNRDAVGARITWMAGGVKRSRLKTGGGSYMSYHDSREILGLGKAARLDWVEVHWPAPSRRMERFTVPVGRYSTIVEGEGAGKAK
jgi:enediyne biosynthesis protein E4